MWAKWLHNPAILGVPKGRMKSKWLHNLCRLGGPTCRQDGYITPTGLGVLKVGTKSFKLICISCTFFSAVNMSTKKTVFCVVFFRVPKTLYVV